MYSVLNRVLRPNWQDARLPWTTLFFQVVVTSLYRGHVTIILAFFIPGKPITTKFGRMVEQNVMTLRCRCE